MSEDAQTPDAAGRGDMDTGRDEARGRGDGDGAPKTSLEKRPSGPGPGETVVSNEPFGWAAPSVHDQQTVTSMPAAGTPYRAPDAMPVPPPWVNPSGAGANPAVPPVNGTGGSFAPPASTTSPYDSAANPFAPPAGPYGGGEPVPPPPIAPDGPGQVPYGYPGYGWPGFQPMPSNGLGTAGLVLGIISAAVFCLWPVAIILGVLALIFGTIGRGKARRGEATNPGQALAGIICGAAGMVFGFVMLAFVIATR